MKKMSLHNIAESCSGELRIPEGYPNTDIWEGTEITQAVLDSRQILPGGLFFATLGERVDGHKFIGSVFEQGAYCVITQKTPEMVEVEYGVPMEKWGAYILVEDSLQALRDIAGFYRQTLKIPIIGITGSVGKTSTKEFIAGVLSVKYKVLKTDGNFNNEIGLPLTLLRIREEHQVAVVEMGISDFGEMQRLSKIARPDICVITNIGQSHLETLKSRDGILQAKTEIFEYMSPRGEVCLNGDDDKLIQIAYVHGKKPHFYGISQASHKEVYVTDVTGQGLFGSNALIHWESGCNEGMEKTMMPVHIPLPGLHMVSNAAAAACIGKLLELTPEQIADGISRVTPVGGRSNLIAHKSYTLLDDCYNANPVSMKGAIDLLCQTDTRNTAILGDMFELGENSDAMHAEIGRYAVRSGLHTICFIGEKARIMYNAAVEAYKEEIMLSGLVPGEEDAEIDKEIISQHQYLHFAEKAGFLAWMEQEGETLFPEGVTVLIKASHGMGFQEIVEAAYWKQ